MLYKQGMPYFCKYRVDMIIILQNVKKPLDFTYRV